MDTMLFFNVGSEKNAVQTIFNYFHLKLLTNPECSFVSNAAGLNMSDTYGKSHKQMPTSCDEFCKDVKKKTWDICLCVAGTDKTDKRRVVVTYVREIQQIVVNFPSASSGFTSNEVMIRNWLTENLSAIA